MTDNQINLIVSTLMLEVMRLRNTYKYDVVAPKAMQDEMDVAYHACIVALATAIRGATKLDLATTNTMYVLGFQDAIDQFIANLKAIGLEGLEG